MLRSVRDTMADPVSTLIHELLKVTGGTDPDKPLDSLETMELVVHLEVTGHYPPDPAKIRNATVRSLAEYALGDM